MSVIEQMYNGKLYLAEAVFPQTAEYRAALTASAVAREKLLNSLRGEQLRDLEDLISAKVLETDQLCLELFRQGVILGARLQRELLEVD